jgi:Putative lumazine-binding
MKNQFLTLIVITMTSVLAVAQSDKVLIEQTINQFAKAGDERDIVKLKTLLHDDFRIAMNRLFGSEKVDFLTKPTYIKMMEEGKLGGDNRIVKIQSVDITENNAAVKVSLKGKALTFQSYYHLVKNVAGQWQIINDLPFASKN